MNAIERLRKLASKASGDAWAFSDEIQGDAPAVVLHVGELTALLDVVEAARKFASTLDDSGGPYTLLSLYDDRANACQRALAALDKLT